jgi:transposase
MAERFVNVDRETPMLLPPDLRDWVADNDLAKLILEAVELCDMQGAHSNVRGTGSEQYPPTMMLALLIYCYATQTFSSRRIERATYDSVAVRYICGNHHPDHDTIAAFRRNNGALFARCFATVVQLARQAGVLKLAAISIDGTRLSGAGSKESVRTLQEIEEEIKKLESEATALTAQAEHADRNERDDGGTQLPLELADKQRRKEKLLAAKAQIEERRRQAALERRADGPQSARRTSKASVSEPQSRTLRPNNSGGTVQGYNAQVAVDAADSGLIVGMYLSDEPADNRLLGPSIESVVAEAGKPTVVLVDRGYESSELIASLEASHGVMVLCPPRNRPHTKPDAKRRKRIQRVFELRENMRARLADPVLKELYRRRAATVEPVFARIKRHMGFSHLHCWGHSAASAEWTLLGVAHNLRKLRGKLPQA